MKTKKCCHCNEFLLIDMFYFCKTNKDKLYNKCKNCLLIFQRIYRKTKSGKEKDRKYKKSEKGRAVEKRIKQTDSYKQSQLKYSKSEKGRTTALKAQKKYISKKENKDKRRKYHSEYCKKRYHNDSLFKLSVTMRNSLHRILKNKTIYKNNKTFVYLGCSLSELKIHIEKQFKENMTWFNHGKWHIDHILPLDIAKTEEDLKKLFHYTNLQPLWASENCSKGSKIEKKKTEK